MQNLTAAHVDLNRFAEQVSALEVGLRADPPAPGGILFYGSSTMVNWRADNLLQRQMAPLPAFSTGFGGSTAEEALYYYARLVLPLKPSILVYYEGDNDLSTGYTPAEVMELSHRLFEWARRDLPGIRFVIIPVKDYPAQTAPQDQLATLHLAFLYYAAQYADTSVIDIGPVLHDEHGQVRLDIFEQDNVHFNLKGYELLTGQVKPILLGLYNRQGS
ncbi:MAG: GDSL-type esterase/lipase family protein [Chloroflexi bacterium]|nr:GDSL-type esterase/lipase family protein [Chloroflexota bacterium]